MANLPKKLVVVEYFEGLIHQVYTTGGIKVVLAEVTKHDGANVFTPDEKVPLSRMDPELRELVEDALKSDRD